VAVAAPKREPEVHEPRSRSLLCISRESEEDILGFDVAMHDLFVVQMCEKKCEFSRSAQKLRESPSRFDPIENLTPGFSMNMFQQQEGGPILFAVAEKSGYALCLADFQHRRFGQD